MGGGFPFPADSRTSSCHLHLLAHQRRSHLIYPDHEGDEATGKLQIRGNSPARTQELGRMTSTNTLQKYLNNLNHHCKIQQTTSRPLQTCKLPSSLQTHQQLVTFCLSQLNQ